MGPAVNEDNQYKFMKKEYKKRQKRKGGYRQGHAHKRYSISTNTLPAKHGIFRVHSMDLYYDEFHNHYHSHQAGDLIPQAYLLQPRKKPQFVNLKFNVWQTATAIGEV